MEGFNHMENNSYRGSFIHHSGWIQTLLRSLEGKKTKKKNDVYNREPNFWSLSKTNKKEAIAAASILCRLKEPTLRSPFYGSAEQNDRRRFCSVATQGLRR